jgi:oxygen-independent coproporphyrinogen-3 oxidase
MSDYSLYLHVPFCRHRCSYCDFNTYAGLEALIPEYTRALGREIELAAESAGERLPVHTIFFGGGTPSLLPAGSFEQVFEAIGQGFDLQDGLELTLEANPGTVSLEYLSDLRSLGFNRISLGMQSADPGELRLLEREHGFVEVIEAVAAARRAGFANLNLDLIFGLPYQTQASWQRTLDLALGLHPEHFSLYALTLEHGTPMQNWTARGLLSEPDPDLAADMYEWAAEALEQAGYVQYEISNWAARGGEDTILACRHNLQYWRNRPYLGLGAGAHGYAGGVRTANVLAPAAYIQRCLEGSARPFPCTPATATVTPVDRGAEMGETMMMGLRLVREGVSDADFQARFGQALCEVYDEQISRLSGLGLLEWGGEQGDRLRLTKRGRLLGNRVFLEFI